VGPYVALNAVLNTTDAIVDQGVLDRSAAFVGKPFTGSILAAKIREVLHGG
jgi:hypothetical protein